MKKFIIGILLGGILLSGGWFAWGAIQQQVGLNSLSGSTWVPVKDIASFAGNPGVATGVLTTAILCHDSGGVLHTLCAGTSNNASFATTQANNFFPIVAAAINVCRSGTCVAVDGAKTNSDTANVPSATNNALLSYSVTSAFDTTAAALIRVPGTVANGLTVDVTRLPSSTQSTTGITGNGAGTTVTMTTSPPKTYTMVVDRTAGSTNVVEIDLQCSINNTAFVQFATITDLTNEPVLVATGDIPCNYMRYNVVTVGAGNTLAIDLLATR